MADFYCRDNYRWKKPNNEPNKLQELIAGGLLDIINAQNKDRRTNSPG
jgi:hypothetical protein